MKRIFTIMSRDFWSSQLPIIKSEGTAANQVANIVLTVLRKNVAFDPFYKGYYSKHIVAF
jgi:hypothetical protein